MRERDPDWGDVIEALEKSVLLYASEIMVTCPDCAKRHLPGEDCPNLNYLPHPIVAPGRRDPNPLVSLDRRLKADLKVALASRDDRTGTLSHDLGDVSEAVLHDRVPR